MKFLTFIDLHEDKTFLRDLINRASKEDIDFIICAGDISTFGRGLKFVLRRFNTIGKKFYVIPGNHEESGDTFVEAVKEFSNCINFDRKSVKIGDYIFLGYGGGGFSMEDPEFRKVSRDWYGKYKGKKVILITHGPPYGTKLDKLGERHVGNKDFRKFIERFQPKVAISGHLHETAGATDKIGETKLINPGWEGMVVELN